MKELIDREEIEKIVKEIAKKLSEKYSAIHCIVVLEGAKPFFYDLKKELEVLELEVSFDFIKVASYVGTKSSGNLSIIQDIESDISKKDLLIVEDLIDTGLTLELLSKHLLQKGAKSVKTCTFLDKVEGRKNNFKADFVGKSIENLFVVGYGMDYDGKYRDLDAIFVLE